MFVLRFIACCLICFCSAVVAQTVRLADVRMRDAFVHVDEATKTYYTISSTVANMVEGGRRPALRVYTSKDDLLTWQGPHIVFQTQQIFWGNINIKAICAPELHAYKGKYYVFATFDTDSTQASESFELLKDLDSACIG